MHHFSDLVPAIWRKRPVAIKRAEEHPFFELQQDMNRLFDRFFKGFELAPFEATGYGFGKFSPSIDVKESDKEIVVTAELPGMEEKDFELLLGDDTLTLQGEKKEEKEEKKKDYYRMERIYGSFQRVIPLPEGIDAKSVDAKFKNGVLTVTLPKTEEAKKKVKKIAVE